MKYLLTPIICLLFHCCKKKEPYQFPHYPFDAKAKEWFTEINLNDSMVFVGPAQSKRVYKITKIEKGVNDVVEDRGWLFSPGRTYFSYEYLQIFYIRTDSILPPNSQVKNYSIGISMTLPKNVDYTQIPLTATSQAKIYGTFEGYNLLPESPYHNTYLNFPDIYENLSLFSYSNSLRSYNEVIKLFSGNNSIFINLNTNFAHTINEIWIDKKFGFVLFKDIHGNTWSRDN